MVEYNVVFIGPRIFRWPERILGFFLTGHFGPPFACEIPPYRNRTAKTDSHLQFSTFCSRQQIQASGVFLPTLDARQSEVTKRAVRISQSSPQQSQASFSPGYL